jgi:HD-like signal output (HDOD) protein
VEIQDILTNEVASPPVVYHKLKDAISDPESTFQDFADIIRADPGLSSRLLRIVNSSFYGLSTSVESVPHALNILGVDQLGDLALATVVMSKFNGIPKDLVNLDMFWKHNIACGLMVKEIAVLFGETNTEKFYLMGLLHDIGSLVLYKEASAISRTCLSRAEYEGRHLYQVEQEELGFCHAEVGGELLKRWRISDPLVESVHYHHNPLEAPKFPKFVSIVHVADIIVYEMGLAGSGEFFIPPLGRKVLEFLQLEKKQLTEIKSSVKDSFEEVFQMFYG